MVLAKNEQFTTVILITDSNNNPAAGKTISYRIFDQTLTLKDSGTMTEIGTYGIYYKSWTPDADGYWIFEAYYSGADFHFYDAKLYQVGKGIEDFIADTIGTPAHTTIAGDIANLITRSKGLDAIYDYMTGPLRDQIDDVDIIVDAIKAITDTIDWTDITTIDGIVDAVKAKTDLIPTDITTQLDTNIPAIITNIAALENKLKASPSVDSILLKSGGSLCPSGKSIWDALGDATISLNTLYNLLTNSESGLAGLDEDLDTIISDVENATYGLNALYTLLTNSEYGLSGLDEDLDTLISDVEDVTYGLSALKTLIDTKASQSSVDNLENKLKASPSVDSILFKSGGAVAPTGKSIWDVLGDATVTIVTLSDALTALENKLKASPSVDSILLKSGGAICPSGKSIWDALGDATVSLNTLNNLLTSGDYGLSHLDADTDQIIADVEDATSGLVALYTLLTNSEYGLAGLDEDTDAIIADVENVTYGLSALQALLVNATYGLSAINTNVLALENKLKASPSVDSILFKSGGAVCPSSKSIWNALGDGTNLFTGSKALQQIYDLVDDIQDLKRVGDTLTTTTNEVAFYIVDNPDGNFMPKELKIDLTNMASGDTWVVKIYYRVKSGGSLILASTNTYTDAQTIPMKILALSPSLYGLKATIQKTAGVNNTADFEVFYMEP